MCENRKVKVFHYANTNSEVLGHSTVRRFNTGNFSSSALVKVPHFLARLQRSHIKRPERKRVPDLSREWASECKFAT